MLLEGIKVIDISQVIAGPIAARHLADFGADVIHVENPQTGDSWRSFLGRSGGINNVPSDLDYNWEAWNRNKKSIAVDLKITKGQEILHKLVKQADVVITNLRFWEKEKYHLDYQTTKKINPKIIYGSITGYGRCGPEKNLPAYDTTAFTTRAGVTHLLTLPGVSELGMRAGFGDIPTGMGLFAGVMSALYYRERTGLGQEVEVSLFHSGLHQLTFDISGALVTGLDYKDVIPQSLSINDENMYKKRNELIEKVGAAYKELVDFKGRAAINPLSGLYRTKNNRYLFFSINHTDRYWTSMCKRIIQRPELENDPRFVTFEKRIENHSDLYEIMKETIASRTLEEWKPILSEAMIPYAPQQKLSEVINDPQARANQMFVTMEHPSKGKFEVLASPINLSETPATYRTTAPEFSQHTEETLLELGYSWEQIVELKDQKIIP